MHVQPEWSSVLGLFVVLIMVTGSRYISRMMATPSPARREAPAPARLESMLSSLLSRHQLILLVSIGLLAMEVLIVPAPGSISVIGTQWFVSVG